MPAFFFFFFFFFFTRSSVLLQVVISLDYIWGFWNILKDFENFSIVEKHCATKATVFNAGKKKKR